MELIVISHPSNFPEEIKTTIRLFEEGLQTFHLRKPNWDKERTENFILSIPKEYHERIVLHHHHHLVKKHQLKGFHFPKRKRKNATKTKWKIWWKKLFNNNFSFSASLHSLGSLKEHDYFDYVFISPVFDSISKKGYGQAFTPGALKYAIGQCKAKVYALGGVAPNKILKAKEMGFYGVALLGAVWNHEANPVEVFKDCLHLCSTADKGKIIPVNPNVKPVKIYSR